MNLEYVDYLNSNNKLKIKGIYNNSFPTSERIPFWILKKCSRSNNVKFNEILYKSEIIGIDYIINNNNIAYLMYFAIDEKIRNKGYGSAILKDIVKKYDSVILSIEKVNENDKTKKRRKNFYLRNGFYETGKFMLQNNVEYELLCSKISCNLNEEKLKSLYRKMSNSRIIQYLINKKFNLLNIELT